MQRTINYQISQADVDAFGPKMISYRILKPQRMYLITAAIVLMAVFIVVKDMFWGKENTVIDWSFLGFCLGMTVVLVIALLASQYLAAIGFGRLNAWLLKKHYQKYNVFQLNTSLQWDERGIDYHSKVESYHCPWRVLYEVAELKDCFLIFTDSRKCIFIPRRVMDKAQQKDFIQMADTAKNNKA